MPYTQSVECIVDLKNVQNVAFWFWSSADSVMT